MRVIKYGGKEVVVSLSAEEFGALTNLSVSDRFLKDVSPYDIEGKQYDLKSLLEGLYQLRLMSEVRENVKNKLSELISKVDLMMWPAEEVKEHKAKEQGGE